VEPEELKKQFDDISKQVKKETKSQPRPALLVNILIGLFSLLFNLFSTKIDELNKTIDVLQQKLGNKVLDSKRANDESINGRKSEKKKGVDSSDKSRDKSLTNKKEKRAQKDVKVEYKESFIGYKGQEYSKDEADRLIGTTFTGDDGRRYKYTRKLDSSLKTDFDITLTQTQYYKLEYVAVGDDDAPIADAKPETSVCAKTDFLKKTYVSISLMSYILYIWIRLKSPLNRVANSLAEYGIAISRQHLQGYRSYRLYAATCIQTA